MVSTKNWDALVYGGIDSRIQRRVDLSLWVFCVVVQRESATEHSDHILRIVRALERIGLNQFRPGDPNPELLTAAEAARYLRLDDIDIKNPDDTLVRYRKLGLLAGTQISKRVFYLRPELDNFLRKVTRVNPR